MQLEDERMKILYALSFMKGGIAQVWAKNKTNVVLFHIPHSPPSQSYWLALREPSATQIGKGQFMPSCTPSNDERHDSR